MNRKWICKPLVFFLLLITSRLAAENLHENPYEFKGIHFLVSYCGCDLDALTNLKGLSGAMHDAVEKSGATILDSCSWVFDPNGLTMVLLLSESHASIHTYPEHGACFVDLFTCGEKCSSEKFDAAMQEYLKPKVVQKRTLIRNEEIQEKNSNIDWNFLLK